MPENEKPQITDRQKELFQGSIPDFFGNIFLIVHIIFFQ